MQPFSEFYSRFKIAMAGLSVNPMSDFTMSETAKLVYHTAVIHHFIGGNSNLEIRTIPVPEHGEIQLGRTNNILNCQEVFGW